jgi:hypothetical protein
MKPQGDAYMQQWQKSTKILLTTVHLYNKKKKKRTRTLDKDPQLDGSL